MKRGFLKNKTLQPKVEASGANSSAAFAQASSSANRKESHEMLSAGSIVHKVQGEVDIAKKGKLPSLLC